MKRCPRCGANLSDQQNICPSCGGDYLQLSIQSITGNVDVADATPSEPSDNRPNTNSANSHTPMLLEYMESSIESVNSLGLPTIRESFSKMSKGIYGLATVMQLLCGASTESNIFFVLAVIFVGLTLFSTFRNMKHKSQLDRKDAILTATTNVFEENTKAIRAKNEGDAEVMQRLDALQGRLSEIKAAHSKKDKENRRKIWIITAVCIVALIAVATPLTINNYKKHQAEAAYEQLPTWVKVRDNFINSEYNDEYADNSARIYVLTEILNAEQPAEAESFFFDYCMGNVGDFDCAKLIIEHYHKTGNQAATEAFKQKLNLRYASDTQKAKQL